MITLKNVSKVFRQKRQTVKALCNVSLCVPQGSIVAIVGRSGAGKSTLLRIIGGMERPEQGQVLMEGVEVMNPGPDRAIVPQDLCLFPWSTVRRNIEFTARKAWPNRVERKERVDLMLKLMMIERWTDAYPDQLSGGLRQKVALARALVQEPRCLLLDEPMSSIDLVGRKGIRRFMFDFLRELNISTVMVTHDVELGVAESDSAVVMDRGKTILTVSNTRASTTNSVVREISAAMESRQQNEEFSSY